MNRLVVRGLDGTSHDCVLDGHELSIGRSPTSGLHLRDPQVSWRHALVVYEQGRSVIQDLGSSNGTFAGGKRVQRQVLMPGDVIKIGPYELSLQESNAPSPTSASEQTLFAFARKHPRREEHAAPAMRPADLGAQDSRDRARLFTLRWSDLGTLSPTLVALTHYRKADARHDAIAGLTVAAMIVPQGMAYAMLAGLPPQMGLYASILPLIVYALTGQAGIPRLVR